PEDRTWFIFEGYVADFPFNFELGAVVSTEISIQRSGASAWIPKSDYGVAHGIEYRKPEQRRRLHWTAGEEGDYLGAGRRNADRYRAHPQAVLSLGCRRHQSGDQWPGCHRCPYCPMPV